MNYPVTISRECYRDDRLYHPGDTIYLKPGERVLSWQTPVGWEPVAGARDVIAPSRILGPTVVEAGVTTLFAPGGSEPTPPSPIVPSVDEGNTMKGLQTTPGIRADSIGQPKEPSQSQDQRPLMKSQPIDDRASSSKRS
jgi:hypothetical protein